MNMPSDDKAELGVVGCCLLGGLDTAIEAVEQVPASAFMRDDCQAAFAVIEEMATQGMAIDTFTFRQEWGKKYDNRPLPIGIMDSPDHVPTPSNLMHYVAVVIDKWRRRKIMYAAQDLLSKASDQKLTVDGLLADAEAMLYEQEISNLGVIEPKDCAANLLDHLEHLHQLSGNRSGLVTGFRRVDELLDGLQTGEQTIIAARPSMGKTAIGLNIAENVCLQNGIPTLFVSCEMSSTALNRRLLSSWMKVGLGVIKSGSFSEADFEKFKQFLARLKNSPLYILEALNGIDSNRLSAAIRRACRKHNIKLVIIDYLQKIHAAKKHEKRTYEVGEVSGALKSLAVQTKTAFLTLAQLNRESEKDKGRVPRLSDLADSGQIERDADTVILLHRNRGGEKSNEAQLIIAKQRDGELGIIKLEFNGKYCRFENEPLPSTKEIHPCPPGAQTI